MSLVKQFLIDERGSTASEYALILAIIGGAIAIASIALGLSIANSMDHSTTQIEIS